jgi:hypothetical protein
MPVFLCSFSKSHGTCSFQPERKSANLFGTRYANAVPSAHLGGKERRIRIGYQLPS